MPSKVRNYKKEHQAKVKRLSEKPGGIEAEKERVKHAMRKRRTDPVVKKYDRDGQRKRLKDPERLARQRKYHKEWRDQRVSECREIIAEWKRNGCCVCGESALCCIDAHHKNQKEKDHNIGVLVYGAKALAVIPKELAKCIPICANCHRKYHAGEDETVVAAVVAITGQPWRQIEGGGVPNGKKHRKEMGRLGPFGKPIYNTETETDEE